MNGRIRGGESLLAATGNSSLRDRDAITASMMCICFTSVVRVRPSGTLSTRCRD